MDLKYKGYIEPYEITDPWLFGIYKNINFMFSLIVLFHS